MGTDRGLWQKYKKDVIIGIITSIASTAILWLIQWLFQTAPLVGHNLPTTIENIIYAKASSVTEYTPFLIASELLQVFLLAAVLTGVAMFVFHDVKSDRKFHNLPLSERIPFDSSSEKLSCEEMKQALEIHLQEMDAELNRLAEEEARLHKKWKELRRHSWMQLAVILVLLIVIAAGFQIFAVKPIEIKGQFDASIQIIMPYTETETIEKLQSDWVLMKSKEDYMAIQSTINRIFEELGISMARWSVTETIISGNSVVAP